MAPLSPEDERLLLHGSSQVHFARGETIFAPTRKPHSVFILERGLVRIYRLGEAGSEVTLGYVGDGEVFGELPVFGDYPRESFAAAALASTVRRFTRAGFDQLMTGSASRAMEVTRQIAERLKRAERRVEHLVLDDARSRLISMLLELAHDFGESDGERMRIRIRLSQAELATLIGATRQTVNAMLAELRGAGLVSQEGGLLVLSARSRHPARAGAAPRAWRRASDEHRTRWTDAEGAPIDRSGAKSRCGGKARRAERVAWKGMLGA